MKEGFIGLDIGTSSVRAVLFDTKGFDLYKSSMEYSIVYKDGCIAEVDPKKIFQFTIGVIKDCAENAKNRGIQVAGIGLSCQMHSLMAVDGRGEPLTNVITWADARSWKEADFIKENHDVAKLYQITGCRIQHPMYPLSKILWIKNNLREVFNSTQKFITIKEFIIFKLFGEYVVDYTLAACQGYFDIHSFRWDDFLLYEVLGIGKDKLSEPVDCLYCLKGMKPEYENAMGISGVPVVIGSGDGIMANLGCGAFEEGVFSSTIGTSGAIRTMACRPLTGLRQETWCYPFSKNLWAVGGAINNGGLVLKWLKNEFIKQFESDGIQYEEGIYKKDIYRLFDRFASEVSAASDGLIFLPYLTGERSPDWNASVRGIMYGLDLSHGKKHIIRAAMEGIMYRLFSVYDVLSKINTEPTKIIASGGYARSDIWLKIQADIFNKDICVTGAGETSALGAAYLCMVALGRASDNREFLPAMKVQRVIKPDEKAHEIYEKGYRKAMDIYHRLYSDK